MTKNINLFNEQVNETLTYKEVSESLGVSVATLKNWVKASHLNPIRKEGRGSVFLVSEIQKFKDSLANGELSRLQKRANKKNSKATFIPKEHIKQTDAYNSILGFIEELKGFNLPVQEVLLAVALELLKSIDLILNESIGASNVKSLKFKNNNVKKVIDDWISDFGFAGTSGFNVDIPANLLHKEDLLGILYQSFLLEGEKASNGSYYTPTEVVNMIVDQHKPVLTSNFRILDPCCGTGQFLIAFSKIVHNPTNLFGFDLDRLAVNVARVNLILAYPEVDFYPNIACQDSLTAETKVTYDIIATNPPWGYHFSQKELARLARLFPQITSKEAFSYFISKGLTLLKDKGYLSYVLPESITKIKQHKDIRKELLDKTSIIRISHIGNVFTNVVSPVILLTIKKSISDDNKVSIKKDNREHSIEQRRFRSNASFVFDTDIDDVDSRIIEKIYSVKHTTLENRADWALGIVTGNNQKYLTPQEEKGFEPILKGSDICKYAYKKPSNFIHFVPADFQQVAPEWKYRVKEKLLYRFISKNLIFAYDDKQVLTLNSANIMIPKVEGYPMKVILALFNSTLYQYLFQRKFNTVKVLRGDIEQLPLPALSDKTVKELVTQVEHLLQNKLKEDLKVKLEREIDAIIYSVFNLKDEETKYIKSVVR